MRCSSESWASTWQRTRTLTPTARSSRTPFPPPLYVHYARLEPPRAIAIAPVLTAPFLPRALHLTPARGGAQGGPMPRAKRPSHRAQIPVLCSPDLRTGAEYSEGRLGGAKEGQRKLNDKKGRWCRGRGIKQTCPPTTLITASLQPSLC